MKQRIKNLLLGKFFNFVILDDVIQEDKGKLYLGNKEITEIEMRSLIAEAKAIESTRLWSIMNETLKKKSIEKGWEKSTTIEELNTGKTIFYTLDFQASIIKKIKNMEKV